MSRLDRWVDHKTAQNLFIWFFLFLVLMTAIQTDNRVLASLFAIVLIAPPVYINNLFILPYFRKKTSFFLGLFMVNTLVFTGISVFWIQKLEGEDFEWSMYLNFLGIMLLTLIFASALKIARDSFVRRQEGKEAELKLLKAQLNPHFLFNTLNNLYGLSVVKSDRLPGLMLKLSDLLRYSLYETKDSMVPLEKEVGYLENYMALEKIRLEDTADIHLIKNGDFSGARIAPMLLIVFVENAFKHLGKSDKCRGSVRVEIDKKDDGLVFTSMNTIDADSGSQDETTQSGSGIGLRNAKKRLDLIYPNKYVLSTKKSGNNYQVKLNLQL